MALAGLGNAASRGHLPAISTLAADRRIALVGAADHRWEQCAAARTRLRGVPLFDRVEAMLDAVDAEILVIATEPAAHARLVSLAFDRGLHVLCEKPLVLTRVEHELIAHETSERPQLALVPVHQYRYSPMWATISRWARRADRLGVPFTLAISVERDGTDRHASSPWRGDVGRSGGMIADHGVHFLALAWTVSERLEILAGARGAGGAQRWSATARVGGGTLTLRAAADAPGRRSRIELRLPGVVLRWSDASAALSVRERTVRRRRVAALSDRLHVDALYVPLYRDVVDHLRDASWRRRQTAEALGVGAALVALLETMARAGAAG